MTRNNCFKKLGFTSVVRYDMIIPVCCESRLVPIVNRHDMLKTIGRGIKRNLAVLTLCSMLFSSCATYSLYESKPIERSYPGTAEGMQEIVVSALESSPLYLRTNVVDKGHIETQYEEYPGDVHGILFWKKQYQERSKYIIDLMEWEGEVKITVQSRTQERVNETYPWTNKDMDKEISDFYTAKTLDKINQLFHEIDIALAE